MQRHNIHLARSFDAAQNDSSVSFSHITDGYQSLHSLSNFIQQFITAQHALTPCCAIEIVQDFIHTSQLMESTSDESDIFFCSLTLEQVFSELQSNSS